jgi:hypothetical protein
MTRDASENWKLGLDDYLTTAPPMPSAHAAEEDEREQRWNDFVAMCRAFAATELDGFAAVLRAVAEALKTSHGR